MTRKYEKKKGYQPNNNPISETSPNPVSGDISDGSNAPPTTQKTTTQKHTEQKHTIIVNITQPEPDRGDITEANNASWWAVKVNIGLFNCCLFYRLRLFFIVFHRLIKLNIEPIISLFNRGIFSIIIFFSFFNSSLSS